MKDDIENRLENLNLPEVSAPGAQKEIKLALINAKNSARASLWLLSIPFLILSGAFLDSLWHIALPPWSWLKAYGHYWPLWLRMTVFLTAVIILPLTAFFLNLLSIVWLAYDRAQKVLNISIRLKPLNLLIIAFAGLLACLFIGHAIADSLAGHD